MASHMAQPGGAPLASLASHSPGAEFSQMMVAHVVSTEQWPLPRSATARAWTSRATNDDAAVRVLGHLAMRSSGSPTHVTVPGGVSQLLGLVVGARVTLPTERLGCRTQQSSDKVRPWTTTDRPCCVSIDWRRRARGPRSRRAAEHTAPVVLFAHATGLNARVWSQWRQRCATGSPAWPWTSGPRAERAARRADVEWPRMARTSRRCCAVS